jgi:hypothetical protein
VSCQCRGCDNIRNLEVEQSTLAGVAVAVFGVALAGLWIGLSTTA